MKLISLFLFALPIILSCTSNKSEAEQEIQQEIQKQLALCAEAVKTKNIQLYMDLIPKDFVLKDQSGEIISRELQKKYTLRDWSIIEKTIQNHYVVDSIINYPDSVIAYTFQRWERLMLRPDGVNKDTILTTQKHIETWKKKSKGWFNYEVQELGGEIYVNGELYKE